jgi:hypothetical protein
LATAFREIDDGETRVDEEDTAIVVDTAPIGTAVAQGAREEGAPRGIRGPLRERVDAGDSAHQAAECSTVA